MGYIYKVTNKVNGKVYIGKTENTIKVRWSAHVSSSCNINSKEYNFKFHRAIRKYGAHNFKIEIIDDVEQAETADREKYWIEFYDSIKHGYNTTFGGEGSVRYSDEFFISCWKAGMSQEDVHKKYGLSRNTVSTRYRDLFSEHDIHEMKLQRLKETNGTSVFQYDMQGNFINEYCSVNEAKRQTGINHIDQVARGERRKAGGFVWSYVKLERGAA